MNDFYEKINDTHVFQWAIIGAGPAGIAAIGKLLDFGVHQNDILWIDPEFQVGDFGQKWRKISSNTTVGKFISYLHDAKSFEFAQSANDFDISQLNPEHTCQLSFAAEPLQWITNKLRNKVHDAIALIDELSLSNRTWTLHSQNKQFQAKNVILAIGAEPIALEYPQVKTVPFDIAIDKQKLVTHINKEQKFAVFGSSHSGIMIIRNLIELGAKKIINFYHSPLKYAINMGDWILFDDTGLKGTTAEWARENIDGQLPHQLIRFYANKENISQYLPECDLTIFAVGFKRRQYIEIKGYEELQHNPQNGIIAPGLFGFGIAYPEAKPDRYGTVEYRVGLFKFMNYLNQILPLWFKYHT